MIDVSAARNKDVVSTLVASATAQAAEKAEEVRSIIAAWGNEPGDLKRTEANTKILDLVRQSDVLKNVAKYLGRFREIFAQGKRNGYATAGGRPIRWSLAATFPGRLPQSCPCWPLPPRCRCFSRNTSASRSSNTNAGSLFIRAPGTSSAVWMNPTPRKETLPLGERPWPDSPGNRGGRRP